ncbi:CDP-diacylglycerol--glycerol-3-phosphate 3-phosphatidyltransferase [uncultured Pigmentiphaga sp.]|jgi:CDP-diacylglycerol--glycerol-3-phosphate 3-phosphatidyltransferase|uniref:CDP-diacylglycerol--glycerol-3-phosphate 3-phosphatidyltransferase n=1 Tax=uncultured Pigmentiphaga sp. TaxID=340361 RepID=UPI0026231635|nr:CDP-diacylglycerol--glycerol-3-phosphate 3-phosphatidyltransferase [uncultured Pigmentiphaga sp.]
MPPLNLPIILTWLRIAMIPLIVSVYYVPEHVFSLVVRDALATGMFIFAALTDWLDGWLARRLNQTSSFGAFLDPVADKLMVSAALLVLLNLGRIDAMVALIIIGREITISALREWMAKLGASTSVAVHWLGKFKTAAQMTAIPCLLYGRSVLGIDLSWWGSRLIEIAAVLTVWSMMYYLQRAWPVIRKST